MPRDGNGKYVPPNGSWTTNAKNGVDATITDWLALLQDIVNALSQSISKDGQTAFEGNISLGNFKLTNLGNPVQSTDAVNLSTLLAATVAAAAKLSTARTIGGVAFDGTANINLPGVNTAGNQNTSGNAATATKLATARAIGGVSFDGTANINLPGVNVPGNQDTSGNAATASNASNASNASLLNGLAYTAFKRVASGYGGIGVPTLIFGAGNSYTLNVVYSLPNLAGGWRCVGRAAESSNPLSPAYYLFEREY